MTGNNKNTENYVRLTGPILRKTFVLRSFLLSFVTWATIFGIFGYFLHTFPISATDRVFLPVIMGVLFGTTLAVINSNFDLPMWANIIDILFLAAFMMLVIFIG